MIVPPNKAIGGISCACIVRFTLIVYSKFDSETWSTTPSVRIYAPVGIGDPHNFFIKGPPNLPQSQSQTTLRPSELIQPLRQPTAVDAHVDRGSELNPKVVADPWIPPNTIEAASFESGFAYPNQSSGSGIVQRLSFRDLATLQELPAACTTDLQSYLQNASVADAHSQNSEVSLDVGFALAQQSSVVAAADETLYNPHAEATQAAFTKTKAVTTKAAAVRASANVANAQTKQDDTSDVDADDQDNSKPGIDPHLEIYSRDAFPSARECKTCHEQIFEEWAASSHAYASISPVFHVFEEKINKLTSGTIRYFCLRCHAPVATTMGLRRDQAIWDGPAVFREGVTCIACHRVKIPYTKSDGERRIEPGDIHAPVYGGSNGQGVAVAAKYAGKYKVKTHTRDKGAGQSMHRRSIEFEELSKSTFCASCHQVAVKPGIKLEVVWDQYRASPACKEGISCQDCHMGIVPGVDAGYSFGPAAVVGGKVVNPERKHSNHMFYGPGYSIAHPGIFPQTTEADKWSINQWLSFDWRSDWGKGKYEDDVADGLAGGYFPPAWQDADDRIEGHSIPALGARNAKFSVPGDLIRRPGVYRLSVRMRSRAEPIYFMRFCNATPEMERMMNEWIADFHVNTVSFEVR